ncbi:MAG: trypsin-like serine protease [Deltaproteobacteria bacterium]|nr:trypsin-like serine protease [Deltaproteobacteria bacterium]
MRYLWVFCLLLFLSCGKKPEQKSQHRAIYYGQPCKPTQFPSSVEIWADAWVDIEFLGLKHIQIPICGGTVIGPKVILTAAHCFKPETITHHWGELKKVRYGIGRENNMHNLKWASHWIQHENYQPKNPEEAGLWQQNDLALLIFEEPLELPAAQFLVSHSHPGLDPGSSKNNREDLEIDWTPGQARGDKHAAVLENAPVWIIGWGEQENSAEPKRMCARSYINELGDWEMQVGSEGSSPRKCFGDSGGATYLLLPNGEYSLVGVTSRSYDTKGCERGGVDTRVDRYTDWIAKQLNMLK